MENNKNAEEVWSVAFTYIKTVVDTLRHPFLILNKDLVILSANKVFYLFFNTSLEQTEGKKVYDLGNKEWNIPKLKILLEDILPNNTHFEDFRVDHNFPQIGQRSIMLNARQIFTPDNKEPIIILAMEDITKQIELEDKLREYTRQLAAQVSQKTIELEDRIKELEKMNSAMVDREFIMMELKKEVKDLKQLIIDNKN